MPCGSLSLQDYCPSLIYWSLTQKFTFPTIIGHLAGKFNSMLHASILANGTSFATRLAALAFVLLFNMGYSQSTKMVRPTPVDTAFLIRINGVEQYLEIKGSSRENPILLFIHGGPSWPATPMLRRYNSELTKDFVLVSWDQRNCGKSMTDHTVKLTTDLYVEDGHQITQYLKSYFNKRKILIVGNSWGSIIGIHLAAKYPEDYFAYIGVGQVIDQGKAMMMACDYVAKLASVANDTATVRLMREIISSPESIYAKSFEDIINFFQLANPYLRNVEVPDLEDVTQLYPDYHYSKIDWFSPLMTSGKELFNHLNAIRLDISKCKQFKTPMYFFAGRYDQNTPSALVEEYFKKVQAPTKNFFWFEHSGHSPQWEEPEYFHQSIRQIAWELKLK